jgi:hypothetical protein
MVSATSTKSSPEQKDKLLSSLGYAKWIPRVVMVPTLFYKKIVILYETIFKDATTITAFTSFIFQFGIDLFWQLKSVYGVNSFAEFLRIREFLFKHLNEIMRIYYKGDMLTTVSAVHKARTVFWNKNKEEREKFIDFVNQHKNKVLCGRVCLRAKDFQILHRVYRRLNSENVYNKTAKRNKKRTKDNLQS